jgi:hypothetical protein
MIEPLLMLLPASLTSGINLYLTVLGLGVGARLGYLELPPGVMFLSSIPVLVVAGVLFLVEFFADKIPYVDNIWDFLHTVVRPAGALVLAMGLVPADQPELRMAAALVAGTAALTAHSSKSSFRALVNTSPEPVSNSVVSVAEDITVVGVLILAIQYPYIAVGVSAVLLVVLAVATVLIIRWAINAFGSLREFFRPKPKVKRQPAM